MRHYLEFKGRNSKTRQALRPAIGKANVGLIAKETFLSTARVQRLVEKSTAVRNRGPFRADGQCRDAGSRFVICRKHCAPFFAHCAGCSVCRNRRHQLRRPLRLRHMTVDLVDLIVQGAAEQPEHLEPHTKRGGQQDEAERSVV